MTRLATTTLPPCPSCKQPATAIYNKKLGCTRCNRAYSRVQMPAPPAAGDRGLRAELLAALGLTGTKQGEAFMGSHASP